MKKIDWEIIRDSYTYPAYREMIDEKLAIGQTTGSNHSEAMLHYTHMNVTRMNRLDKTTRLVPEFRSYLLDRNRPQIWLTLTEAWCGDAAQVIPVLNQLALVNEAIDLRLILRDEHPEVMDAFLTNGGRSIPKVIILNAETRDVMGTWGPRPADVQKMVMDYKQEVQQIKDDQRKKELFDQLLIDTQKWYAKDKTVSIQREFMEILVGQVMA
jgi:hypothetical protein